MTTLREEYNQSLAVRQAHPGYFNRRFNADEIVTVACWQYDLFDRGFYNGPADGSWGPNSRLGVQYQVRQYGYAGPIDGEWGANTWKGIQRLAQALGNYQGSIDGVPGRNTWEGIFLAFVPID